MIYRAHFGFLLLASALFLATFFPSYALAESPTWEGGKKYALIVGIDDYQNDGVVDLHYATSDAKLLQDVLIKEGKFPKENIFLLTSDSKGESDQPFLTNIVFRLEWLKEIVGPGDTLVFYFAGHGVSLDKETFLLTEEADQRSKGTLMISSLRGSILNDLLKNAGAQNTLVFLDACRNDPTVSRGDGSNLLSPALSRGLVFTPLPAIDPQLERNTATIFACSEGERSWEWADQQHGFFTYYLAEAFRQGAFEPNGLATLGSLSAYLRDNVSKTALRETNHKQTPMMRYEGPGPENWVLARRANGVQDPKDAIAAQERSQLIARAEAAEFEAKKSAAQVSALQAQEDVNGAEREVLVRQNDLLKAQQGGGDVALAAEELEFAQDNLKLAKENIEASQRRLSASVGSHKEAAIRLQTSEVAEQVAVLFGNQSGESETIRELKERLTGLESQLADLYEEKRVTVERAIKAERQLAALESQLALKWEGRALGKRPTRRTKREDLWRVVDPGAEEADSL